jgi:hypothetical protein
MASGCWSGKFKRQPASDLTLADVSSPPEFITIVSGLARSGTSLMMQTKEQPMGESSFIPPPSTFVRERQPVHRLRHPLPHRVLQPLRLPKNA